MKRSLPNEATREVFARLHEASAAFSMQNTGEPVGRQPVHTMYGGAHLFRADAAQKLGSLALQALDTYAGSPASLAEALFMPAPLAEPVYERVKAKLSTEPVEDYRIDFEDGYGDRPDAEEDNHAAAAAAEVAKGLAAGSLPPSLGIRIKPLTIALAERAARTLDIFLSTLWTESGGRLPDHFVVTLPKITIPEQVSALAELFDILESNLNIPRGTLKLELMIETLAAVMAPTGQCAIPGLLDASDGRCVAAHFGAYDYTAEAGVTADHQSLSHPACDFARHMMQASLGRAGIWLADGATNALPVPIHRERAGSPPLSEAQRLENSETVRSAWKLHFDNVRRSLAAGFYQGWDLHPSQLVSRYAAVSSFFLEGLDSAADRLSRFLDRAAQATLAGRLFDDAATGQGLLNFFLRAIASGSITEAEARARTGLSAADLATRSFLKIAAARRL